MVRRRKNYRSYDAYSSYSKKRRRGFNRINWKKTLIISGIIIVVASGLIYLNYNRIRLLIKGYDFSETSQILKLTKEEENKIISYPKLENIETWLELSTDVELYDEFDRYQIDHEGVPSEEVVGYIEAVFPDLYDKLIELGYKDNEVWVVLQKASIDDIKYVIDNKYTNDIVSKYNDIKYFKYSKLAEYISAYEKTSSYAYAVNAVNFPQIISSNNSTLEFEILNPESETLLIKKGFKYSSSYVPSDLAVVNIPIHPDTVNTRLRQIAASALEKLAQDADQEGLKIVMRDGYRSYQDQVDIYNDYTRRYGGAYAAAYAAKPGSSEHQTGLSVDVTSQSVVDGNKITFGDTQEYAWVLKHAHEYGFILRYPFGKESITGINSEPWHLRYVGVEMATSIYDSGLTFEEYCLYNSNIPDVNFK